MNFLESLTAQLKRHEGLSLEVYRDSLNVLTIGYGHNLAVPITMDAASQILQDDIAHALFQLDQHKPFWRHLPDQVKVVVANMCFNLGWTSFSGFKRFWAALEARNYHLAGVEMRESLWYTQVKSRGEELVSLMQQAQSTTMAYPDEESM